MIRFSMYSGEEIKPDNQMNNFNDMANVYQPLKSYVQSPAEENKNTHDVHNNMENRDSNTSMPITEGEGNCKSNNDKTCAPLAIIEESIQPFAVSKDQQKPTKKKISTDDATISDEVLAMKNQAQSYLLRQRRHNDSLLSTDNKNLHKYTTSQLNKYPYCNRDDPLWHCNHPPPPPFPTSKNRIYQELSRDGFQPDHFT